MPPATLYTGISLGFAFVIFCIMYYLVYALIITLIKYNISSNFKTASISEKLQHIVEAINMPEAYGDWDTDLGLDLDGHLKKWKSVLKEMLIMVLMQCISNMSMLVGKVKQEKGTVEGTLPILFPCPPSISAAVLCSGILPK